MKIVVVIILGVSRRGDRIPSRRLVQMYLMMVKTSVKVSGRYTSCVVGRGLEETLEVPDIRYRVPEGLDL